MQKQREHWGTQLGFLLAAAGSAIGLGTLWKFPYVVGENGGGLFMLFYMFCIFFIGIPVFIAELILGRRAQRGAVGIFDSLSNGNMLWKSVGWMGVISSLLIMSFYSVIAGWGLNYVLMSLVNSTENHTAQEISGMFDTLAASGDITIFWHLAFTALTVAVVLPGIRQGIEYWNRFMTMGLLIILVLLCAYSITLEGFPQAVNFLFSPDFSKFKPSSMLEALGLSFFALSLGQGIMLTYGSYMRRNDDIPKTGFIIGGSIILVSIIAGLMIFPIIFTFGFSPQEGTGLIFKTLPLLFSKLPGSVLISTIFFIMFTFTALTSAIAFVEVIAANFMDLLGWTRKKSVLITGAACFIFGIPSALSGTNWIFPNWEIIYGKTFFGTIDTLVSVWLLPISGFMIALFTGWFLDKKMLKEEFQSGTCLTWLFSSWLFFLRWIVPVAILAIIFQKSGVIDLDKMFLSR